MIEFCLCASLSILAIYVCINWQGMIFNGALPYLERYTPAIIKKPLYECLICMSSIWGGSIYLVYFGKLSPDIIEAILIIAGINTLLCVVLDKLTDYGC